MTRTINQTKAIKRQREARRWFSVAEWCRDMYASYGSIGYLHEYHHASALAMFHARAARILIGCDEHRYSAATFEIEIKFEAKYD